MTENALTKREVVTALTRSSHGNLDSYVPVGRRAAQEDIEFFSHLIAWNAIKGSIRDSKVALPVIALDIATGRDATEFYDNAQAHILKLDPRELVKAVRFSMSKAHRLGYRRHLRHAVSTLVSTYLREREASAGLFDRAVAAHRDSMKALYALTHRRPSMRAQSILFERDYSTSRLLSAIRDLKTMPALEAAGAIIENRIPFLTAKGALGKRAKEPDVVLALIERMSPTELVTNAKSLEAWGVMGDPVLRGAFTAALERAKGSKKNVLKTSVAASHVKTEVVREALASTQEAQLGRSVEGDWLVLGDCSGSMAQAIEVAREVAGVLARSVKGRVHLVFFATDPRYFDVTGKTLAEITEITKRVTAAGGTAIGCGIEYLREKKIAVDGIAIVSDGGDNRPPYFNDAFVRYRVNVADPTVYFYKLHGEIDTLTGEASRANVDLQTFDLRDTLVDHYSIPNLVHTMRAAKYSLVDEIMATPLLKVSDVIKFKEAA